MENIKPFATASKAEIEARHIENNPIVYRVMLMVESGELTEKEGLYVMVNFLATVYEDLQKRLAAEMERSIPAAAIVGGDAFRHEIEFGSAYPHGGLPMTYSHMRGGGYFG